MTPVVLESECPELKLVNKGKVRDIYDVGEYLLIVTTDRISAFDVIMNEGIPDKGLVRKNGRYNPAPYCEYQCGRFSGRDTSVPLSARRSQHAGEESKALAG